MSPLLSVHIVLLVIAAVCFGLEAVGVASPRIKLLAFGLLCWVLAQLVPVVAGR